MRHHAGYWACSGSMEDSARKQTSSMHSEPSNLKQRVPEVRADDERRLDHGPERKVRLLLHQRQLPAPGGPHLQHVCAGVQGFLVLYSAPICVPTKFPNQTGGNPNVGKSDRCRHNMPILCTGVIRAQVHLHCCMALNDTNHSVRLIFQVEHYCAC